MDIRVLTDEGKHHGAIRGLREANGGIRIVGAKITWSASRESTAAIMWRVGASSSITRTRRSIG